MHLPLPSPKLPSSVTDWIIFLSSSSLQCHQGHITALFPEERKIVKNVWKILCLHKGRHGAFWFWIEVQQGLDWGSGANKILAISLSQNAHRIADHSGDLYHHLLAVEPGADHSRFILEGHRSCLQKMKAYDSWALKDIDILEIWYHYIYVTYMLKAKLPTNKRQGADWIPKVPTR